MKISENITIYAGMENKVAGNEGKPEETRGKSIFAGDLNNTLFEDRIEQRRKEAQEQAMKVVSDAWEGDRAIDEDLENRRSHITELRKEMKGTQDRMQEITEMQKQMQEEYGVAPDSQEMQDLEEEKKALLEDYNACMKNIKVEIGTISATKLERLKHHPMVDAQKQAEEILADVSKEIIGMAVEDAREHLDEEQEKREEQAEALKEERKEQENFIEAQKEKKKEAEELVKEMPVEEMISLEQVKTDVQKQVQNIMDKMKLVAEDMKGAVVDQNV